MDYNLTKYNEFNIIVERGEDLDESNAKFFIKDASGADVDLSAEEGEMNLLREYGDASTALTFDTSSGSLVFGNGSFHLNKSATEMEIPAGAYLYAVKTKSTEIYTIAKGLFIVRQNI